MVCFMTTNADGFTGCDTTGQGTTPTRNIGEVLISESAMQSRSVSRRRQSPSAMSGTRDVGVLVMVMPNKNGRATEADVVLSDVAGGTVTSIPFMREIEQCRVENLPSASPPERRCAVEYLNSDSGSSNGTLLRNIEVREMLVYVERELAESREECAKQSTEIDNLRAAVAQEQEANRRTRNNFEEAMRELREDSAGHIQGLTEQINVLKRLSENVLEEKTRIADEAAQRKQHFLALLERERKEKSEIMESYRQQTESLIAEQGKEITTLRAALHSTREDCERQLVGRQDLENKLQQQQERLADMETFLEKERAAASQRQQESKQRYLRRIEELATQNEELTIRIERDAAKLQEWRREALDHERGLSERLRAQEEKYMKEQESLKEACVREVNKLKEEVREAQTQLQEAEHQLKMEKERTLKSEEKTIQTLQQAVEQLRQEKEAVSDEMTLQCEGLRELHNVKVNQLQSTIDSLRRQLADENATRVNAEAERDLVTMRAEGLQTSNARLTSELETLRAECRAKERVAVQERHSSYELLRAQLRDSTVEVDDLKQRLLQRDLEEQRLRDEITAKVQAVQALRTENKRLLEEARSAADEREREACEHQVNREKCMATLHSQKAHVEAECQRLQQLLGEMEARNQSSERLLEDERQALKEVMMQLTESRDATEEYKASHRRAQARREELEEELQRKVSELDTAGERIAELETAMKTSSADVQYHSREAAEKIKAHEVQLQLMKREHEEEVLALQRELQLLSDDVAKGREVVALKDVELRRLREEVSQLRRDADNCTAELHNQLAKEKMLREDDLHRLDDVLNTLRNDLSRSQKAKAQCLREVAQTQRDAERQRAQLQEMLEQVEGSKERLQEESRHREQLNSELQGTVRLLSSRLATYEDDNRRLQEELTELNTKLHDTHTVIGRKDATIGQLTARLRAYEARLGSPPA